MCILCLFEAFIEYIRLVENLEMGEPFSEEEERAFLEKLQGGGEYITLTNEDGKTERFKFT